MQEDELKLPVAQPLLVSSENLKVLIGQVLKYLYLVTKITQKIYQLSMQKEDISAIDNPRRVVVEEAKQKRGYSKVS